MRKIATLYYARALEQRKTRKFRCSTRRSYLGGIAVSNFMSSMVKQAWLKTISSNIIFECIGILQNFS